jgi:hypothetical protein
MRIQHVFITTVVITLIVSLLCISFFPSIQDFMEYNTLWNGIRRSLNELNASTIDSLQGLTKLQSKSILICIPNIQYNNDELERLKTFVDGGGTLVVMDDYGYGNSILEYLNIGCRFSGNPLLDPLFCYKNQWFPKITNFSPLVSQDVEVVVLNHATSLVNTENTEVVAWSSSSSFLDQNGNESWDKGELKGTLPVATKLRFGEGAIILVSDPSILINSMLGRDDNLLFIINLLGSEANGGQILLDTSHLVKKPMDITKSKLIYIKDVLSQPYAVLGIVSLLFIFTSSYMLKIGGSIGRKS